MPLQLWDRNRQRREAFRLLRHSAPQAVAPIRRSQEDRAASGVPDVCLLPAWGLLGRRFGGQLPRVAGGMNQRNTEQKGRLNAVDVRRASGLIASVTRLARKANGRYVEESREARKKLAEQDLSHPDQ
jgi:hypothetical protein